MQYNPDGSIKLDIKTVEREVTTKRRFYIAEITLSQDEVIDAVKWYIHKQLRPSERVMSTVMSVDFDETKDLNFCTVTLTSASLPKAGEPTE